MYSDLSRLRDQTSRREFVLAALRSTHLRVKLIANEIGEIGIALKGELISPDMALEWAQDVAPGCVGFVPVNFYGGAHE
jgi:hypothetical protein